MRIKPAKEGNVLVEVSPRDSQLFSKEAEQGSVLRLKRILVPIDFSECSRKALQYAVPFAKQFGAEVLCLHVIEIPYGAGESGFVTEMEVFRKSLLQDARKRIDEFVKHESAKVPAKADLRSGAPY